MYKETVYMVCDSYDEKAKGIQYPNEGVEHLGTCRGRLLTENGDVINSHVSSTFDLLRQDLARSITASHYIVIDLIGHPVPKRFRLSL